MPRCWGQITLRSIGTQEPGQRIKCGRGRSTAVNSWCLFAAWELAQEKGVTMPIVEQLQLVLTEGKDPKQAVSDLMNRPSRHEDESVWLEQVL